MRLTVAQIATRFGLMTIVTMLTLAATIDVSVPRQLAAVRAPAADDRRDDGSRHDGSRWDGAPIAPDDVVAEAESRRPTMPALSPATTSPTATAPNSMPDDGGETGSTTWEVILHDPFEGDELADWWRTCYWWQRDGGCTISSNAEQQWYRPEGVSLEDGHLVLTGEDLEQRTTDGDLLPFRSGMVSTGPHRHDARPRFTFTYGRVEVVAQLPRGNATWPAIWLLPASEQSRPEIDIMEWYGTRPELVTSHIHGFDEDGQRMSRRIEAHRPDIGEGWHEFAVTWRPDSVIFEIDGEETGRITETTLIPDEPMYLIINLALGGRAGEVDPDDLPQEFRIDEVTILQEQR